MPYPPPRTTWPGQTHEFHELCGAHQLLVEQRLLDGLVFERHDGVRLAREEGLLR